MPDVRVGIVTWNTGAVLDRCLASLPAALDGLEAEVVLVDNASNDDSAAIAERYAGVTVIRSRTNDGYSRGMNRALAGTAAPVLVALNPDTVCPPGSLAALVQRVHDTPEAGIVVPRLSNEDGSLQHSVYRFPSIAVAVAVWLLPRRLRHLRFAQRWWLEGASPHDRSGRVDWALGAVHAIRREALDGAEPYTDRWFMYSEDTEICWRLTRAGFPVYFAADIDIVHVGNVSGAQAWGAGRPARYWRTAYDLVAMMRGRFYARVLAVVNTAACASLAVAYRAGSRMSKGPVRRRRTAIARDLRTVLPVHAGAARHGPPAPEPPPVTISRP